MSTADEYIERRVAIYNSIPVHYCRQCGSLSVMVGGAMSDYCGVCGSVQIAQA